MFESAVEPRPTSEGLVWGNSSMTEMIETDETHKS